MSKNYISHIADSKTKYHRNKALLAYEEKFKILLELQKIDCEMKNSNKNRNVDSSGFTVWGIEE